MIDIIVQRGEGDRQGADIADPLMATINCALARGRTELDEATLAEGVKLITRFLPNARRGQLLHVVDPTQGGAFVGKITGIEHRFAVDEQGNISVETALDVRRPR